MTSKKIPAIEYGSKEHSYARFLAENETYAEISRLAYLAKQNKKSLIDIGVSPIWIEFYKQMNEVYKMCKT